MKWALAGRSQERLEKLRLELSTQYGEELKDVPLLIGDVTNQASFGGGEAAAACLPAAASCPGHLTSITALRSIHLQASLDSIAAQTRVMLSTAGPFALVGTPVVDAAVRGGAHYVVSGWAARLGACCLGVGARRALGAAAGTAAEPGALC